MSKFYYEEEKYTESRAKIIGKLKLKLSNDLN